jgi:anti-anti-sigma regulatory factor
MVLRIESVSHGQRVILRLSGRLQSEHVDQLKAQVEGRAQNVILDLDGIKLVDREVVCFLERCEASGVQLRQCPLYLREWITRERAGRGDV